MVVVMRLGIEAGTGAVLVPLPLQKGDKFLSSLMSISDTVGVATL